MYFIFVFITLLVASGALVTLAVSRFSRVRLAFPGLLLDVALTTIIAVVMATVVIAILLTGACMTVGVCEVGGLMEGGLIVGALWLICYFVAYIVGAFVIARLRSRSAASS